MKRSRDNGHDPLMIQKRALSILFVGLFFACASSKGLLVDRAAGCYELSFTGAWSPPLSSLEADSDYVPGTLMRLEEEELSTRDGKRRLRFLEVMRDEDTLTESYWRAVEEDSLIVVRRDPFHGIILTLTETPSGFEGIGSTFDDVIDLPDHDRPIVLHRMRCP